MVNYNQRSPIINGIFGGLVAGIVFMLAEMVMNAIRGQPFFGPARMISAMVLGPRAIDPGFSLAAAFWTGLTVHMVLSMLFGALFAAIVSAARAGCARSQMLVWGSVYGFALWIINFQVISRVVSPWFLMADQFWNGFVAHTFFFGTVLGYYMYKAYPGVPERLSEKRFEAMRK